MTRTEPVLQRCPGHARLLHQMSGKPIWLNCCHDRLTVGSSTWAHDLQNLCLGNQLDIAVDFLENLDREGAVLPFSIYQLLLRTCAKRRALLQAKRVYAYMVKHELDSVTCLGESLVSTFVKCGAVEDAVQVLNGLTSQTVYSWTAVISGYASSGRGHKALRIYQQMRDQGVEPNAYTFLSLIKACGGAGDLAQGKRVHAEVVKYRYDGDLIIGTCLVEMYGRCGSLENAENVFYGLCEGDVISWTAMLAAYVEHGQAEKALLLYGLMREQDVSPTDRTYVAALQACAILAEQEHHVDVGGRHVKVRSFVMGRIIHADAYGGGFSSDAFVLSTLTGMYGKCGSMTDAQIAFDGLASRDVVSWTVLIAAYVDQSQAGEALQLYGKMLEEGISADARTFVSTLQACRMLAEMQDTVVVEEGTMPKALQQGKEIHANIVRKGYGSDLFICNTLISMYGKCGSLLEAKMLFNGLPHKDVVSINVLLTTFIEHGLGKEALTLYMEMKEEGLSPVVRTFVSVVQACGIIAEKEDLIVKNGRSLKLKCLQDGKALHAEVQRKNHDLDVFVSSALLCMYVKCGSILDARCTLDGLAEPNMVAWGAVLAAYIEQGSAKEVLQLYGQMQEEGLSADASSLVCALQACAMLADEDVHAIANRASSAANIGLQKGKFVHAHAWIKGFSSCVYVSNTLISMYIRCGSLVDARHSFDGSCNKDVVSWNVLVSGYVEQEKGQVFLDLYRQMLEEGVSPDGCTFLSVLQGCGMLAKNEGSSMINGQPMRLNAMEKGRAIHAYVWTTFHSLDAFIGSALVRMYGRCGSIIDAKSVFDSLQRNDVVLWNAMLAAYVDHGLTAETFELYEQMQKQGISQDCSTLLCLLHACSNIGNLDMVRQIHHSLASTADKLSALVANALIGAYGRCAAMVDAEAIFDGLAKPTAVSWNALIAGFARHGSWADSLERYERMQLSGVEADGVTFLALLSACSHAGLVQEGVELFESMSRDHGILPRMEHYVTIMDLLGRAGNFSQLEALLSSMPVQPDLNVWSSLLAACRTHGQVDLGRKAFDCVVRLQPAHTAAYFLMWNIYADAGLWECAREVNGLRRKAGAWERPAQSWVGHDEDIDSFEAGDQRHGQVGRVHDLLQEVTAGLCPTFDIF